MNRAQFEVLVSIEANELDNFSNEIIDQLFNNNLIDKNNKITKAGLLALEPYRVKRAIFFAAGFGSRLVPITYNTPKPLIDVHGKRMIDTLLDAILKVGIEEIIIVRGYLKDNFDILLKKYPMIKFIDNDAYNEANNISSAIMVKDLFANALILESDLILSDQSIIRKYEYSTNYRAIEVDKTDDWCFEMGGDIVKQVLIGGENVHQMIGISYWSEVDGKNLAKHLEVAYSSVGGKDLFWDEVALKLFKDDYLINIHEISSDAIIEIDSYQELSEFDSKYKIEY